MYKWVFILFILITAVGCNQRTIYDEPVIVIEKAYSEQEGFTYRYTIEIVHKGKNNILRKSYKTFWFHTNHNWDIGDTIWVGARWGKQHKQTEE